MLMQMLEAGGIEVATNVDDIYDEHNPNGYYDHDTILNVDQKNPKPYSTEFFESLKGNAIKVYAGYIRLLPKNFNYKIIFVERALEEVWASRLKSAHNKRNKGRFFAIQKREKMQMIINNTKKYITNQDINLLNLLYPEIIQNPKDATKRISTFLNSQLNEDSMIGVVDSSLHKEKAGKNYWVTDRSPLATAKLISKYAADKIYCEIGIGEGHNLNLVQGASKKFGIEVNRYGFNRCKQLYPHLKIYFGNYLKLFKGYSFDVCFLWIVYPFCKNIVDTTLTYNPDTIVLMGLNYFYHLKDGDPKKEIYIKAYPKEANADEWNQSINNHLKELEEKNFCYHIEQVKDEHTSEIFSVAVIQKK